MILKDLNIEKLLKLVSIHVDQITCIECCKYYSVPTTAICGHTLCHSCWRGRGTCPSCGLQIEKKALMLNLPVQSQKEHVYNFVQTFEDLFNMKLEDFLINIPAEKELEDPNKNVKAWLSSSENHFSAPVTDSQQSPLFQSMEQDLVQTVKHVTSDIQVHSEKAKILKSIDVVHITPQQDDWDKIEEMPEIENNKHQENPAGPMDMESFGFLMNDKIYSSSNPRRSSRKKENYVDDNIGSHERSSDKNSHKTFNENAENNSTKLTKNWNNVKRMKKEFSKLNKKNKNKLNISIEMCKKTQTNKGGFSKSPDVLYEIEDNTPTTKNNDCEVTKVNSKDKLIDIKESSNENINPQMIDTKEDSISSNKSRTNNTTKATSEIKDSEKENHIQYTIKNNQHTVSEKEKHIQNTLKNNEHNIPKNCKQIDPSKVCFFKKGALNKSIDKTCDKTVNPNEIGLEHNNNTDDIEISIKIGSTIANIYIKKKENDIQFKINSDREIQTSLTNLVQEKENSSCSPHNVTERQNINSNNNDLIINEIASVITKVQDVEKFTPSKKNTASADTATIQNEITESIEKELANTANAQFSEKTSAISQNESKSNENVIKNLAQQTTKQLGSISEDIEFLNDDIFDGESVKEANIQPLKTSKNTPSAILKFTMKSNKTKSQKDKRDRDCTEIEDLPNNKKRKISHSDSVIDDNLKNKSQHTTEKNVMEQDSENMNYDAIMSQVFANIDADMGKLPSSSNKNKSLQYHNNKRLSEKNEIDFSPKSNTINNKEIINEEFSENIFSLSKGGQDSEIFVTSNFKTFEDKENTKITFEKPCEELGTMANISKTNKENNKQVSPTADLDIIELSSPVHDEDSDKSVVEETPQKTQSFTRNKNKNEGLMCNTQQSTTKAPKPTQSNMDTEDGANIINLSDTMGESTKRSENVTVVETKRPTLETPVNITKFVDQIKHKSTPVARKSLNFMNQNDDDPEQTLCPSSIVAAKTTQEKEFLFKAFNQSLNSPTQGVVCRRATKLCIAGSCLTTSEQANLRLLCSQRKWTFVDKYTKELTHLVVGVDEENKSQRSVKYMCALAGAKWIVSYTWVERCLETNSIVDEEAFEALDGTGEPGPRRSRLAKQKLFHGITFYCMPPFSVLDIDTLKDILRWAGGCVVGEARAARAGDAPALLLAEPEHTQEDRFIYLAMELNVVPVNYEWVLNCLGSYTLGSIHELLLCPASLLPKATAKWPSELISRDYE